MFTFKNICTSIVVIVVATFLSFQAARLLETLTDDYHDCWTPEWENLAQWNSHNYSSGAAYRAQEHLYEMATGHSVQLDMLRGAAPAWAYAPTYEPAWVTRAQREFDAAHKLGGRCDH